MRVFFSNFLSNFSFLVKIFKGLTELSLKLLFKEIALNLMNKNLISQIFIKFFKPKFILICILPILLAEDDIHQSVDMIVTSEEILEQVLNTVWRIVVLRLVLTIFSGIVKINHIFVCIRLPEDLYFLIYIKMPWFAGFYLFYIFAMCLFHICI